MFDLDNAIEDIDNCDYIYSGAHLKEGASLSGRHAANSGKERDLRDFNLFLTSSV